MRTTVRRISLLTVLAAGVLAGLAAAGRIILAPAATPVLPTVPAAPSPPGPGSRPSVEHSFGWRGDGSGQFPSAEPCTRWSATENVLWKAEVGAGSSQPVVVGPRVFVTAEPDLLICLDADTGTEVWRKAHPVADFTAASKSRPSSRSNDHGEANPVPVSDGKWVWVYYGTGVTACYDVDGHARWARWCDYGRTTEYARTASPVLAGDRLLVHFGPLVCLDAATGKALWKNEAARATYGTPAPARVGGVDVVITPAGDAVRVADGKLLATDLGRCTYASPVVRGRVVYFIDGSVSAVLLPEKAGEQFEGKELWFEDLSGEFYASPIVDGGRIYAVNRSAVLYVIDAATGRTRLKKALDLPPGGRGTSPNVYPSLCLAGNHLFVGNDAGETALLEPGDAGTAVGLNALPAGSAGTPVFAGRRMYVRGGKFLYCVGER